MAASERADLIVTLCPTAGSRLVLQNVPFNRAYGSVEYRDVGDLFAVAFAEEPEYAGPALPRVTRAIDAVLQAGARHVSLAFTLTQQANGTFEYVIDGVPFAQGRPMRANLRETQI